MLCVCVPGKRYNLADVSAALCMSLGLIWFTLADSKVAPNFNVTGNFFYIQQPTPAALQKCSNTTTSSCYTLMVSLSLLKGACSIAYEVCRCVLLRANSLAYCCKASAKMCSDIHVFSFVCLCVCCVQVFSSSPWHCVQTPSLETCRRKQ